MGTRARPGQTPEKAALTAANELARDLPFYKQAAPLRKDRSMDGLYKDVDSRARKAREGRGPPVNK